MRQTRAGAHPLRSGPVRRWLAGLGISLVGDQVFFIALGWSAVQTTGPGTAGLILAAGAVPRVVLMLIGGVMADRLGPRRVLIGSDTVRMVVMVVVAALLAYGEPRVVTLFIVSVTFGIVDALFQPGHRRSAAPAGIR